MIKFSCFRGKVIRLLMLSRERAIDVSADVRQQSSVYGFRIEAVNEICREFCRQGSLTIAPAQRMKRAKPSKAIAFLSFSFLAGFNGAIASKLQVDVAVCD